jgi:hypothetical protein
VPSPQRVSLGAAEGAFSWKGAVYQDFSTDLRRVMGATVRPTFVRAVKQGVVEWSGAAVTVPGVPALEVGEVVVSDEARGGVWRLKGLPIRWEQRLEEQALALASRSVWSGCYHVPT